MGLALSLLWFHFNLEVNNLEVNLEEKLKSQCRRRGREQP
jgi:hypothetical protein